MHRKIEYIARLKTISFLEMLYRLKRWRRTKDIENALITNKQFIVVPELDLAGVRKINLPEIKKTGEVNHQASYEEDRVKTDEFEQKNSRIFFSKIKLSNKDPDIRSVWESARLQRIIEMLFPEQPDSVTDGSEIKTTVLRWIKANPFLFGVHYLSPMECGLRVPVFLYALSSEKIEWGQEERKEILSALYKHSWWISNNLALYSSLGNHTICECLGLIFGGAVFMQTEEGKNWLKTGYRLLEKELSHQILNDGGPAEQSLNYHRFVLDLYWLAVDFLEKNRLYDCSSWKPVLRKCENFLEHFLYDGDQFPSIGDSDDGYAVAPGLCPDRQIKGPGENKAVNGLSCKTFQESGYTVIRNSESVFMTFDHGSLGMAPLYNHGHADALSINLYKKGKPFIVDPGTYRYNGVPEHRAYFKGTRAHNTICIDNLDQARQLTGFVWDKPYKANLTDSKEDETGLFLKATHNGYSRLKHPVIHTRDFFVSNQNFCLITDSFSGKGIHEFELNFHLHPDVVVEFRNEWLVLNNQEEKIFMHNPDNSFKIIRGQKTPLLGWYSPHYGILQETNTLQSVKKGVPENTRFSVLICFDENSLENALELKKEVSE